MKFFKVLMLGNLVVITSLFWLPIMEGNRILFGIHIITGVIIMIISTEMKEEE